MKIVLGVSAMAGFTPVELEHMCRNAWKRVHPNDMLTSYIMSDGEPLWKAGTGLESVCRARFADVTEIALPSSCAARLWRMDDGARLVLDIADGWTWHGGTSERVRAHGKNCAGREVSQSCDAVLDTCVVHTSSRGNERDTSTTTCNGPCTTCNSPWGSSAALAPAFRIITELVAQGVREVQVHVPQLSRASDLGIGLLEDFTGRRIVSHVASRKYEPSYDDSHGIEHHDHTNGESIDAFDGGDDIRLDRAELAAALAEMKSACGHARLVVTYPYAQPLLGFSGMAYSWMRRGYESSAAQQCERAIGQWASDIVNAGRAACHSLLNDDAVSTKSVYAGVGGGLGLLFDVIGASFSDIGHWLLSDESMGVTGEERFLDVATRHDLALYVCGPIGVDLPGGLHEFVQAGELSGIPVVVLTQSSGLRRGELASLGLTASYDVFPDEAFDPVVDAFAVSLQEKSCVCVERSSPREVSHEVSPEIALELTRRRLKIEEHVERLAQTWGWD